MSDATPDTSEVDHSRDHGHARSTEVAGQVTDEARGRIYPCPSCGADLVFRIGSEHLNCGYCGYEKEIVLDAERRIEERDLNAMLEELSEKHDDGEQAQPGDNEVRCDSCGGTVLFSGTLTSTSCPYCASPLQRDNIQVAKNRIGADGILPLQIDEPKAHNHIGEWVKGRWFAPNRFLREGVTGEIHSVYLPFWTFDAMTFNVYRGQRGDHYTVTVGSGKNRRTVTKTRWSSRSGQFQRFFDDVVVLATRGLPHQLIHELEPWPFEKLIPFTQEVSAGHYARTYDLPLREGFANAKLRIEAAVESETRRRIGGDVQRISSLKSDYDALTFKHLLMPVWIFAYRYGDKPYQVFVNGATGEVQGQRPYSWIKIMLAVIAGAAVAGIIALVSQS